MARKSLSPTEQFRHAIDRSQPLRYRSGLSAIQRGQGRGQITAAVTRNLLGSVYIDGDCRTMPIYDKAHRWDYAVGYSRRRRAHVFYIEAHPADSHGVRELRLKLDWLEDFVGARCDPALRGMPSEYHWVASGKVKIPKHVPQYRELQRLRANRKLHGPHRKLEIA